MDFKDNVIESFKKIKDTIIDLDIKISALETQIQQIQTELIRLKQSNIPANPEFEGFEPSNDQIQESSTGNEGVCATVQQQCNNSATTVQQPEVKKTLNIEYIEDLKRELMDKFSSLTEAELKVFLSIYRLEEELNRSVRYIEISRDLKISTGTVRTHVLNLLAKKVPLQKHVYQGTKVELFIEPEFKNLKLLENLLSLREKSIYSGPKNTNLRRNFGF